MKILFVAVFTPNSTNVAQARGLKNNGCTVYTYEYRDRARIIGNIRERDQELIDQCKKLKPDLVIFSKCNNMHYRVVDECNKVAKTCLWYMDGMNNFDNELVQKIKRCSYVISGVEGVLPHMLDLNTNSIFINQCPDERMNFMLDNINYKDDISFIGSIQPEHTNREYYINILKESYPGFKHYNGVYGLDHNNIVNNTKINLNITPYDIGGISVRVYKILASGGFLMSTPWKNMEDTFKIDEEIIIFNSEEELRKKVDYYLNNENERNRIRLNGYKKGQEFLPKSWAEKIIKYINNES